jgi:hypothetical protein
VICEGIRPPRRAYAVERITVQRLGARSGFFELAELQKGPIAIEAVKRIDVLFDIER